MSPSESAPTARATWPVRWGFYLATLLAVVLLAFSILTWNMLAGALALALAVLLFRNLDVVGAGDPEGDR